MLRLDPRDDWDPLFSEVDVVGPERVDAQERLLEIAECLDRLRLQYQQPKLLQGKQDLRAFRKTPLHGAMRSGGPYRLGYGGHVPIARIKRSGRQLADAIRESGG